MNEFIAAIYEEPLENQNRAAFDCGQEDLNRYFQSDEITRQIESHDTAAFVLRIPGNDRIVGYYTMSNAAILRSSLPRRLRDVLRYGTTPALLVGRLARDVNFRGDGIGRVLLECAWKRCIDISQRSGCAVLIVDTIDDSARDFYGRAGFVMLSAPKASPLIVQCECGSKIEISDQAPGSNYQMQRMYMPIAQVQAALA